MKGFFRENALINVDSPEQLNKYISVVHLYPWVGALSVFGAVTGFLIWAFTGSITSGAEVHGVIFPEGGIININTKVPGYVADIRARVGDYVVPGELLAIIPQNDVIHEIEEQKKQGTDNEVIEELINEYCRRSFVLASNEGRVTRAVEENAFVSAGDYISTIIVQNKISNNQQVAAYVPLATAKNLKEGMEAQISPVFAPREEFGYMKGYISSIGSYPITRENIDRSLLVFIDNVLPDSGFIQVIITLLPDGESDNLINWSNPKGRSLSIEMGTACKILIITDKSRPIDKFFEA